ncbi:MAG TPA: BrnT family toxin [Pyrinomonadaceae bacterium]|jgi:hypothetical protein
MEFVCDENKAKINLQRHGGSFAEAEEVFDDLSAIEFFDDLHSEEEERFRRVGLSAGRLLFVVYSVQEENGRELIRLISARKADAREERIYNEYNR